MSSGREAVLARVRAALVPPPQIPDVPRAYRQAGALGAGGDSATVNLFCQRVADYRATVRRVHADELPGALLAACEERKARRIAVPAGALAWTVEGVELVPDDPPLSPRQLDELDGVLSDARSRSPKPERSCSTGWAPPGAGHSRSCPTTTFASSDLKTSFRPCLTAWQRSPASPRRGGR